MKKKPLLIYVSPKSSTVREFNISFKKIILWFFICLAVVAVILKISVNMIIDFDQDTKVVRLRKENQILLTQLNRVEEKIKDIRLNVDLIFEKDDQIRTILDLPKIDANVRKVGVGGRSRLSNVNNLDDIDNGGRQVVASLQLLEKLDREIRLEQQSYKKLITTVEKRLDSLQYLPVLKPLKGECYISSNFGWRLHPILKKRHFHHGVDIAAKRGTAIIAPADGIVVSARQNGGYGMFVVVNHKYGYITRYGHMSKILVKRGQRVKRGDTIGQVGDTGLSTGHHLHYEVSFQDKRKNPIEYFLDDIIKDN